MLRNILYKAFSVLGSREVAAFEADALDCRAAQERKLLQILQANCQSEYGKRYGFASIKNVADFQKAVPICDYEALSPYIDRIAAGQQNILTSEAPFMFAITSGTTGSRKLIPITHSYMSEFRKASVISGYHMLKNFPALAGGVTMSIFSPAEEGRTQGDLPYGAITGLLYKKEPALIKKFVSPIPYEVYLMKEYEARYYTLLRCAIMLPLSCIYTLNPSTIVLLARRLKTHAPSLIRDVATGNISLPGSYKLSGAAIKSLRPFLRANVARARFLENLLAQDTFTADRIWPSLTLVSCWTRASASFYLQDFPELFGSVPVCDITYGASEGRGTVFLSPEQQALAIRSHFFEFKEVSQSETDKGKVLTASELTTGQEYYILFTTSSGLYRYNINDIVRVVGWYKSVPLLEFLHKGGNISSFTGEKLTESQATQAVFDCARSENITIKFFTVIAEFRPEPHYQLWLESNRQFNEAQMRQIAETFDDCLCQLNSEYETKRLSNRLAPAQAYQLASNCYENLRKDLVAHGVPDAQIKISHLNPKGEIKDRLKNQLLEIHQGVISR
jgi:hypothetical protein